MSLRREDWDPAVLSSPCNGCGGDNDERGFINPYWSCLMRNASSDKARQFFQLICLLVIMCDVTENIWMQPENSSL